MRAFLQIIAVGVLRCRFLGKNVGTLLLAFAFFLPTVAVAQSPVTSTPAQLTVVGVQGDTETRTLLLSVTAPVTNLQLISLDLLRADNKKVLPKANLQVGSLPNQIEANGFLTVPVTVDMRNVPSGQFTGVLLAIYEGGRLSIPVSVTVKDGWGWPLVALLGGVAIGTLVSAYRAQGQPRDEILVRVGRLRTQVKGDAELAESFRQLIEASLVDVEVALQAAEWDAARQAVKQAEAVWVKWRKDRVDWIQQFAYSQEVIRRLEALPADAPYVAAVRRGVEGALRNAPTLAGPHVFQDQLETAAQQVNHYLELQAQLDELNNLRSRLPAPQAEPWRLTVADLQRRLNNLPPSELPAYTALQNDIEQALAELTKLVSQRAETAPAVQGGRTRNAGGLRLLSPAPLTNPPAEEEQAVLARFRLRALLWVSYFLALAFLAGAGFSELYVAQPAFGADAWRDYFALLAWGFGAEATRAAIADLVRGWGLPGLK